MPKENDPKGIALHRLVIGIAVPKKPQEEAKPIDYEKEFMCSGFSKGQKYEVDPQELKWGIDVEYEHTSNRSISEKIARDHLMEIDDYYTRLHAMEEQAKKEGHYKKVNHKGEE